MTVVTEVGARRTRVSMAAKECREKSGEIHPARCPLEEAAAVAAAEAFQESPMRVNPNRIPMPVNLAMVEAAQRRRRTGFDCSKTSS